MNKNSPDLSKYFDTTLLQLAGLPITNARPGFQACFNNEKFH